MINLTELHQWVGIFLAKFQMSISEVQKNVLKTDTKGADLSVCIIEERLDEIFNWFLWDQVNSQ